MTDLGPAASTAGHADGGRDAPFGAFALPAPWGLLRWLGGNPSGVLGRAVGHRLAARLSGPVDIVTENRLRLRLHPAESADARALIVGGPTWRRVERVKLRRAIAKRDEFAFVDLGAGDGIFSLDVLATAQALGRRATVTAIEPSADARARLAENLAHNGFSATIHPATDHGAAASLLAGLPRIDALKIEAAAAVPTLEAFFAEAPKAAWPRLILSATGRADPSRLIPFLASHTYRLVARTTLNAMMELSPR
ncbi:MAG: hypothetical protein AAF318_14245 [Pseudomonadota bacterium]